MVYVKMAAETAAYRPLFLSLDLEPTREGFSPRIRESIIVKSGSNFSVLSPPAVSSCKFIL